MTEIEQAIIDHLPLMWNNDRVEDEFLYKRYEIAYTAILSVEDGEKEYRLNYSFYDTETEESYTYSHIHYEHGHE